MSVSMKSLARIEEIFYSVGAIRVIVILGGCSILGWLAPLGIMSFQWAENHRLGLTLTTLLMLVVMSLYERHFRRWRCRRCRQISRSLKKDHCPDCYKILCAEEVVGALGL